MEDNSGCGMLLIVVFILSVIFLWELYLGW